MQTGPRFHPKIAITMGDPSGVGPEIIVKAFSGRTLADICSPFVVGASRPLQRAIELLGKRLRIDEFPTPQTIPDRLPPGTIPLVSAGDLSEKDIAYGRPSESACALVVRSIEKAVSLALHGSAHAVCTCPINKANLHRHGFPFPGHTELIRDLTRAESVVMMLAGPKIRVSLVTIHEPLAEAPRLLTPDALERTIRITGEAMVRDFGLENPHVAVAGLNPHAGEEGRFGREEIEVIRPTISRFQAGGSYRVSGPYPADTLFHRAWLGEFDAVVAMYHDQGLIPVKLVHFYEAVNLSLGLQIVRTSVDHGTAYEIAGTGKAHAGSLEAAIALAAFIARNRARMGH